MGSPPVRGHPGVRAAESLSASTRTAPRRGVALVLAMRRIIEGGQSAGRGLGVARDAVIPREASWGLSAAG